MQEKVIIDNKAEGKHKGVERVVFTSAPFCLQTSWVVDEVRVRAHLHANLWNNAHLIAYEMAIIECHK